MTGGVNPWLRIPAADYEAHMASPEVRQARMLERLFGEALERFRPSSLAVLGCSAGNGFEHLRGRTMERVVAIDINPEYVAILGSRYRGAVPCLETICDDIASVELEGGSMDLVWCALVLEYVDPEPVVGKAARWLREGGVFSVVLQRPSADHEAVTSTPFKNLRLLEGFMKLVDPSALDRLAEQYGLERVSARPVPLETGKELYLVDYRE